MLSKRNRNIITVLILIFSFSLIIHRWQQISIFDEVSIGRNWYWGDGFSSRNVYSAAMHFKDSGFAATSYLPVLGYEKKVNGFKGEFVYTHYPALPDILGGVYAIVFNTWDPHTLAVIPMFLSLCMFFLIYRFLSDLIKDEKVAFVSASILMLSNYFICWADDMHQHVYTEFFKWLMICLLYHYYENKSRPFYYIVICAVLYLAQSNLSFEPIVFLAIIVVGFSWIYTKSIFKKEVFLLLAMPVIGVGIHLVQNYFHYGSWEEVYYDMYYAFLKRTVGTEGEISAELALADVWVFFQRKLLGIGHYFLIPATMFIFLAYLALKKLRKENRKLYQITKVFLLAGLSWSFVMTQHSNVHMFTIKHMAVFYGTVIGIGLFEYRRIFMNYWYSNNLGMVLLNLVFIYYTLMLASINHVYYVYLKYGFAYPYFGKESFHFHKIADYLF